jgi:hypothetical protein
MYAEGTIEEASPKYMAPDPIRRTPPWVFSKLNVRDAPVDTKQVLRHNLPPARPLSEIFGLSSYAAWEVAEICKAKGYIRPKIYQAMTRAIEGKLVPVLRESSIMVRKSGKRSSIRKIWH